MTQNIVKTAQISTIQSTRKESSIGPGIAKRILDLSIAIPALILLSPLMGIIALLVRFKLGSPVLFKQKRPGINGVPFTILKFRTMKEEFDEHGRPLPDKDRLTPFGAFLRRTSLDELPELFNVLRGEMSLVGPRPLLMRYTPYFTDEERIRFTVPPGITGLAQVSGRNDMGWDERLAADVEYVRNRSLLLDLRILFLTLWRVLSRQGVQVAPNTTMPDLDVERAEKLNFTHDSGESGHLHERS